MVVIKRIDCIIKKSKVSLVSRPYIKDHGPYMYENKLGIETIAFTLILKPIRTECGYSSGLGLFGNTK